MVCTQTCTSSHKVDQSLWQTLGSVDLLYTPHKWFLSNIVMWEIPHNNADWDYSKTQTLLGLWRLRIDFGENLVYLWKSHTHVCSRKLDVQDTNFSLTQFYWIWSPFLRCRSAHGRFSRSHSVGFGDWTISFRTKQNRRTQERAAGTPSAVVKSNMHNPIPIQHTNVIPTNIDHIPSNTKNSNSSAMLHVFEDTEAVIKMIIKGRSPTMKHVSRTHRVALDWLFDRINLDAQIQIRYIDTKHQLADMLTSGNFTRDEWNNLLHLFD